MVTSLSSLSLSLSLSLCISLSLSLSLSHQKYLTHGSASALPIIWPLSTCSIPPLYHGEIGTPRSKSHLQSKKEVAKMMKAQYKTHTTNDHWFLIFSCLFLNVTYNDRNNRYSNTNQRFESVQLNGGTSEACSPPAAAEIAECVHKTLWWVSEAGQQSLLENQVKKNWHNQKRRHVNRSAGDKSACNACLPDSRAVFAVTKRVMEETCRKRGKRVVKAIGSFFFLEGDSE